jgi:hypothetical protein
MNLADLQDLLVANQDQLYLLKVGHSDALPSSENGVSTLVEKMSWEAISAQLHAYCVNVVNLETTYQNTKKTQNITEKQAAASYKQALLILNNALGKGIDYLRDNKTSQEFLEQRKAFLHSLLTDIQRRIEEFKANLHSNSNPPSSLPSTQSTTRNLKEALAKLSTTYEMDYKTKYTSSFWRAIKMCSRNPSRAAEIKFLQTLSAHPDATDAIRVKAMDAVRGKIAGRERHGKGSLLRKELARLIPEGPLEGCEDIAEFCRTRNISIPSGVKAFITTPQEARFGWF